MNGLPMGEAQESDHMVREETTNVQIEPMQDRVLVKRAKGAEKTDGGLFIPESARERMGEGEVVAVGPGRIRPVFAYLDVSQFQSVEDGVRAVIATREYLQEHDRLIPPAVKVGDKVLFSAAAGTPLELEEVEKIPDTEDTRRVRVQYVLLREEDVLAVVHGQVNVEVEPVAPLAE